MSDFWLGVLAAFGVVGGLVVALGLVWLVVVMLPEGVWWTVKRLPLHDEFTRDRTAALVASARRAYTLRIPQGVRLTLTLGENREGMLDLLDDLGRSRRAARVEGRE
ncbi:hypothetical protein [Micromonospora costi]|uniref:Uncharacterized protein n=1 Tax=Micromonospora costi TaxID=1530042 RepID=A0A3B0A6X1_9ACTN|nr:hypothetical protein [Micromonospora costi]RKN56030.1 hypothetical protein D7193_15875 [Micromonospora costi]